MSLTRIRTVLKKLSDLTGTTKTKSEWAIPVGETVYWTSPVFKKRVCAKITGHETMSGYKVYLLDMNGQRDAILKDVLEALNHDKKRH